MLLTEKLSIVELVSMREVWIRNVAMRRQRRRVGLKGVVGVIVVAVIRRLTVQVVRVSKRYKSRMSRMSHHDEVVKVSFELGIRERISYNIRRG